MSFLFPLYLAGAAAIGLPILLHLIKRRTNKRVSFSSLMFLKPSPPRLRRRSRIENLLLLLLRCAAILLLATAFARPFLSDAQDKAPGDGAERLVVVLDASASMRRADLWSRALAAVGDKMADADHDDRVSLIVFDRSPRNLVTFDQWSAAEPEQRVGLAKDRLSDLRPGWGGTGMDLALVEAAELIEEDRESQAAGPARQRIILVSDFQAGAELSGLRQYPWPKDLPVERVAIEPERSTNAGMQPVDPGPDGAGDPRPRVRVTNSDDSDKSQFTLRWTTADGKPLGDTISIGVPAGQSRVVTVPSPPTNADHLALTGDDHAFDNRLYVAPPTPRRTTIVLLANENKTGPDSMGFYIRRVFAESRSLRPRVVAPTGKPNDPVWAEADLVVIAGPVPSAHLKALRNDLALGRVVLWAPRTADDLASGRDLLNAPISATESKRDGYAMLEKLDFEHPYLAPFADPRFGDFTKIHFWHHRVLDLKAVKGSHVMARFDTGDPAFVQAPGARGSVVIMASGWHPADSDLARSSKFVPLLYSLLENSGRLEPARWQYNVGEPIALSPFGFERTAPVSATTPTGTPTELSPDSNRFGHTAHPGLYRFAAAGADATVAVNMDPSESRTATAGPDRLAQAGVSAAAAVTDDGPKDTANNQRTQAERQQKMWRWLVLGAFGLLLIETLVAGRQPRTAEDTGGDA